MKNAEESKSGEVYDPLRNVAIIEEIMEDQTKYSAYVDTLFLAEEKAIGERDEATEEAMQAAAEVEAPSTQEDSRTDAPDTDVPSTSEEVKEEEEPASEEP